MEIVFRVWALWTFAEILGKDFEPLKTWFDVLVWWKSNCGFKLWILNYVVAQSLSPVHLFASHELQHTRLSCPSLLIKIGVITINTLLPTRNKFVYSCSIKIHASGFDEFLESIFLLFLVVEAFSPQKVVEMLEEVVNRWQEVRWIR